MPLRRRARWIGTALAVPLIAAAGLLFASGIASGESAGAPNVRATDVPNQPNQPNQAPNQGPQAPPATDIKPGTDAPPTGGGTSPGGGTAPGGTATATATAKPTTTASPTRSPTASPTPSPTRTASPTVTGTASPQTTGPGRGGGAVGPLVNCAGKNVNAPVTVKTGTAGTHNNVLVDADGCALYMFALDTTTTSACDSTCENTWFPVPAPAQATNPLSQQDFTVFNRASGKAQVAFAGHQLYYYSGDKQPGQANGQGFNQNWFLVNQDGTQVP